MMNWIPASAGMTQLSVFPPVFLLSTRRQGLIAEDSTLVRLGNEDADNAVIDESLISKSTHLLRKVKALKFERTKQYMKYEELPKTDNNAEIA